MKKFESSLRAKNTMTIRSYGFYLKELDATIKKAATFNDSLKKTIKQSWLAVFN